MRRARIAVGFAVLVLTGLLAGCTATPAIPPDTTARGALVFGYFDMAESPFRLQRVDLAQGEPVVPSAGEAPMHTGDDGVFYLEDLPPGRYRIPAFVSGGFHNLMTAPADRPFTVPPGAIVFIGAFDYVPLDEGRMLSVARFEMRPVDKPTEADVLRRVQKRLDDPRWQERIAERLKALGG